MININSVSFRYAGSNTENLTNFTLRIEKGECVVLTGESGCGKTCVTRLINTLIPHFYEGELTGEVTIDGVNTASVQRMKLQIKLVLCFKIREVSFLVLIPIVKLYLGWKIRGCLIPKWYSDTKRLSENFILRS